MPRDKKKRGKKKAKPARGQGANAIAGQPPRHDEPAPDDAGKRAVDYIGTSTKGARAPPHGICAAANNDVPDRLEQLVQKHTGGKQARTKQRKKKGKRAGKGAAPVEGAIANDEKMWERLEYFLKRVVPAAEGAGVRLAMHPDDPPMSLRGQARIMRSVENFDRLLSIVDSPCNGITFCQGCFSEMGADISQTIRHFGDKIYFVHFRDVAGEVPNFRETFHDNGKTDMHAAMRAYREIGYDGVMRPDHAPFMAGAGDAGDPTGYTMLGKVFAVGYMRGLIESVMKDHSLRK